MKEAGTTHWATPNTGATDSSGFTGLPGGFIYDHGLFYDIGNYANFWSSTEASTTNTFYCNLSYKSSILSFTNVPKTFGFTIRCIKD